MVACRCRMRQIELSCSVDTILSGMPGDINKVQRELLDLSAGSAQKLKILNDKIIDIASVPDSLFVNKEIQASLPVSVTALSLSEKAFSDRL